MSQPRADWPRTLEEFRVWHERQPEVYEFIDGVPRRWKPGSKARTLIKGNVARALGNAVAGAGYHVLVSGARIEAGNSSVIPDIVLARDPPDLDTARVDEPVVIVEILAPIGEKTTSGASWPSTSASRACVTTSWSTRTSARSSTPCAATTLGGSSSQPSRRPTRSGSTRRGSRSPSTRCTRGCHSARRRTEAGNTSAPAPAHCSLI
jgi:hypothetical protein